MKNQSTITIRPFALGQIVATPGLLEAVTEPERREALLRHRRCDWGECGPEDWAENDSSVDQYLRLLSVYRARNGIKFWIITEADRSATTLLLPDEY